MCPDPQTGSVAHSPCSLRPLSFQEKLIRRLLRLSRSNAIERTKPWLFWNNDALRITNKAARHTRRRGLIFYHGFFFFFFFFFFISPSNLRVAERNSTKIGRMIGRKCNLKTHVQNLGYLLPYKSATFFDDFATQRQC